MVIAGRDELDKNTWAEYEGAIARFPLNPFTDEEAIQYLHRKGITNDRIIEVILHLSGRLPLLVATLAAESPNDPTQIGDPSETAVERFLKWIDDPKKRQVAIDASLPRLLNRDIIAVLQGEETADDLFNWLKSMPFVEQRTDGWMYHDIARTQMLRYKRRTSPQSWADLHGKLADYYKTLLNKLQLEGEEQWLNNQWISLSLELVYHQLCKSPEQHLSSALEQALLAFHNSDFYCSGVYIECILQAGEELRNNLVRHWTECLSNAIFLYKEANYEKAITYFKCLEDYTKLSSLIKSLLCYYQGRCSFEGKRLQEALTFFNRGFKTNPESKIFLVVWSITKLLLKLHEESIEDCNIIIENNTNDKLLNHYNGLAYIIRGLNQFGLGLYEEALSDFKYAEGKGDQSRRAWLMQSLTYWELKRYEEGLNAINIYLESSPDNTNALLIKAGFLCELEDYKGVIDSLSAILEVNPDHELNIRKLRSQIESSLQILEKFSHDVELDPSEDRFLYNRYIAIVAFQKIGLGESFGVSNFLEHAIQLAQQGYNEKPEDHQNTFNLAIYHLAAGNTEQSKHFYRDALNRRASTAIIREAIRDLEDFLTVFPGHPAAQAFKQGLEQRVNG